MRRDTITYWLALRSIDTLGSVGYKNLLEAFGSPEAVFNADENDLVRVHRISRKIARRIREFSDWTRVEDEIGAAEKHGITIVTAHDASYPKDLLNIYDFPPLLYVKGVLHQDDINIAVIGSRMASTYGRFMTERLCRELALKGVTVVSGMARGIDSAAHRGALAGRGRTIAVLGSGIDVIYPPENRKLYEKIAATGAVITEFPFATEPKGPNFPSRNRIISGISLGVVVVEATEKSGSLITVRLALEQGKEVFAVPGSIDSPGSRGTHRLLKEGAKLVENVYDILEEVLPQVDMPQHAIPAEQQQNGGKRLKNANALTPEERNILNVIGTTPMYIDTIIQESGFESQKVLSVLLSLELSNFVEQLPGKQFIIKE